MHILNQVAIIRHIVIHTVIATFICCGLVLTSFSSHAKVPERDAQQTIRHAVEHLLSEFTEQRSQLEQDHQKLYALVDEIVTPLFDLPRISKLVLSKNWRKASKQQRKTFMHNFKALLVKTYAIALFKYTGDEKLEFTRTINSKKRGRELATVKSRVTIGKGAAPIPVDYAMMKQSDGTWKVWNLTVDGLNLVMNYRKSYANIINQKGLDGFLTALSNNLNAPKS